MKRGQQVDSYILEKLLGAGGLGEVWVARQDDDYPRFAIKFLKEAFLANDGIRERFLRECNTQRGLEHDNIVKAYPPTQNPPGIVMDLIAGGSLAEVVGKPMELGRILTVSFDVLDALEFAHQRGVVHRDIKPQNILLAKGGGTGLLSDFGMASVAGETRLTRAGDILGSDQYLSPEQISKPGTVDRRSDIYSFGCVLYQMLTGVAPFEGDPNPVEARLRALPVAPTARNRNAAWGFDRIVMTCLFNDPAARYPTCRELAEELEKTVPSASSRVASPPVRVPATPGSPGVQPPASIVAPAPAGPPRRWLPYAVAGAGVLVLGIILLAAFGLRRPRSSAAETNSEEVVIRLYGSTSIGDELAHAFARKFLEAQFGATKTGCYERKEQYKSKEVSMQHCWGDVPNAGRRPVVEVYSVGSEVAFQCLAEKSCDVGMASRPYKPEDSRKYPGLENLATPASEHVIGLDGIAIVVNPRNDHITGLTLEQVKRTFCNVPDRITTWDQLGVSGLGKIHQVVRNEGGTRSMFVEMVCKDVPLALPPPQDQLGSEALAASVAANQNTSAIGFVSSTLIGAAIAAPIQVTSDQTPRRPDNFSVAAEDYPLTRRLYLYNRVGTPAIADKFIKFANGEEGQQAAADNGFVPLTAEAVAVPAPPQAPPAWGSSTQGAKRLSLSFRFSSGQTNFRPDQLAEDNVERVKNYLRRHSNMELLVFGFADNQTPPRGYSNEKLSLLRAQTIAASLETRGLPRPAMVEGFGEAMPSFPNDTEERRQRNRRVEVWVRERIDGSR
jgi:phosphate transport system substrate-binding protein